jgi:hypothetical protein
MQAHDARQSGPRLPCVVSKKQRRRRIAQAGAERRAARLAARAARRRRRRAVLTTLAVLVAVVGLVLWIVTRDADREGTAAAGVGAAHVAAVPMMDEVTR